MKQPAERTEKKLYAKQRATTTRKYGFRESIRQLDSHFFICSHNIGNWKQRTVDKEMQGEKAHILRPKTTKILFEERIIYFWWEICKQTRSINGMLFDMPLKLRTVSLTGAECTFSQGMAHCFPFSIDSSFRTFLLDQISSARTCIVSGSRQCSYYKICSLFQWP